VDETQLGDTMAAEADATGRTPARREQVRLDRGDALGRYVVIDVLGAGGMGVVERRWS
jgi:hypothetical protein